MRECSKLLPGAFRKSPPPSRMTCPDYGTSASLEDLATASPPTRRGEAGPVFSPWCFISCNNATNTLQPRAPIGRPNRATGAAVSADFTGIDLKSNGGRTALKIRSYCTVPLLYASGDLPPVNAFGYAFAGRQETGTPVLCLPRMLYFALRRLRAITRRIISLVPS